jgi:hypothetical protein
VKSLALLVTAILAATLGAGILSWLAWRRPPRHPAVRVLAALPALVAVASGGRLALLDIGGGVRAAGALVALAGAGALVRLARGPRPT